jgi:hypothetical protein
LASCSGGLANLTTRIDWPGIVESEDADDLEENFNDVGHDIVDAWFWEPGKGAGLREKFEELALDRLSVGWIFVRWSEDRPEWFGILPDSCAVKDMKGDQMSFGVFSRIIR